MKKPLIYAALRTRFSADKGLIPKPSKSRFYSFGYVAGWSSGRELAELKSSLETIRSAAAEIINSIDANIAELQKAQDKEQTAGQEQPEQEAEKAAEPDKDTFSIYQLKRGDETRDFRFEPYDRLQAAGLSVEAANYDLIYTAPLTPDMTLESIWEKFNIDHPKDFKGHSLSVSDVVVLHQNGQDTAHYVDSFGYKNVPEFLQEQKQLNLCNRHISASTPFISSMSSW